MLFEHLLQNRNAGDLSPAELAVLENSVSEVRHFPAGEVVVRERVPIDVSTLLVEGMMSRHIHDTSGRRHVVAVHFAGDFVDLHAYALKSLDHNVGALTDVKVALVPHIELARIQVELPHLTHRLWFLTLIDAAMHRQWVYRLSGMNALARVAHFLCECNARLLAIGRSDGRRFQLPMTQAQVGEVCALTGIHVNRVMRDLRDLRLCTFRSQQVDIHDLEGLVRTGQFDPNYLYLNDMTVQCALGHRRPETL
ncbi:Crp/Fnr family transcriptional regulator [soil metagenome]